MASTRRSISLRSEPGRSSLPFALYTSEEDKLDRYLNSFATQSFRDQADRDYIAARLACVMSCSRSSFGRPSRLFRSISRRFSFTAASRRPKLDMTSSPGKPGSRSVRVVRALHRSAASATARNSSAAAKCAGPRRTIVHKIHAGRAIVLGMFDRMRDVYRALHKAISVAIDYPPVDCIQ